MVAERGSPWLGVTDEKELENEIEEKVERRRDRKVRE